MNSLTDTVLKMMDTTQEPEDYKGEAGLLYCGKCHKLKEAYFPKGKALFGRDRHPSECDCHRAERERQEKKNVDEKHNAEVERLKREGFSNPLCGSGLLKTTTGNTRLHDELCNDTEQPFLRLVKQE